jgi:hypothetical protein
MEVDASRKAAPLPPVCYRCRKPGHVKSECPHRFDVRYMELEEKDELIQQFLAEKDATIAAARAEPEGEDFQ